MPSWGRGPETSSLWLTLRDATLVIDALIGSLVSLVRVRHVGAVRRSTTPGGGRLRPGHSQKPGTGHPTWIPSLGMTSNTCSNTGNLCLALLRSDRQPGQGCLWPGNSEHEPALRAARGDGAAAAGAVPLSGTTPAAAAQQRPAARVRDTCRLEAPASAAQAVACDGVPQRSLQSRELMAARPAFPSLCLPFYSTLAAPLYT